MKSQPRRREAPLSCSLTLSLTLPRSPCDIWCWRRCLYRKRGKKGGRFLLLNTKTGGEVNTQSFARPHALFSAGNCQASWWKGGEKKRLSRPSRRKNETLNVWFELKRFFCLHVNNWPRGDLLLWQNAIQIKQEIVILCSWLAETYLIRTICVIKPPWVAKLFHGDVL